MINHVRTLLQNMPPGYPSDEYVDPDFVPMPVPEVVDKLKVVLFGRTPANQLRIRQLMQLVHATELEDLVLAPDPRITYLPFDNIHFGSDCDDLAAFVPQLAAVLTPASERELFGDTAEETNEILFELWKNSDQLPYKLGALVLAMVYCTERARK